MMEESHLCLTWNDHGVNYQQELAYLRNDNILTDVTLACDGHKFLAHKLVLATCSDFFKSILGDVPCQHPIVYLRGVDGKVMQALLDFMYVGTIEFPKANLNSLLSTAQSLQIKSLGVMTKVQKDKPEEHPSSKRKRSPITFYEPNEDKTSSSQCPEKPKIAVESFEEIYLIPSPKRSHREQETDRIEIPPGNFTPSLDSFQNKENVNSYNRPIDGSILGSLFNQKPSQSSTIISNNSEDLHSPLNTTPIEVSLNNTPTQMARDPPDPTTKTRYHYPANFVPARNQEEDKRRITLQKDIKEEPLDCSQGSTLERIETQPSAQSLTHQNILTEKDAVERRFKIQDGNQDFSEKRVSTTQISLLPLDENLENGVEQGRPYSCPICKKSFAKAAILKRHHLAHFRPYSCHLCPRSFTRREVLAEHVLEHNGADLRLPCPVCNMTIKRKRNLQAHIKVKHPDYYKEKLTNKTAV